MDVKLFISDFKHIASTHKGVQALREMILQLAIEGNLVTPSSSAESASELIARIANHVETLKQENGTRRRKSLSPIDLSKTDLKIPDTWVLTRLGNICEIVRGVTFPASQKKQIMATGLVPCLRTANVQAEIEWNDLIYISEQLVKREDQWLRSSDIVISMANSYELVGKVALAKDVNQKATFGGFLAVIRPYLIIPKYLYLVLHSPYMKSQMRNTASQTTNIANISLKGIRPIPIPVPPVEEQERITSKVDGLMAICDKLDSKQRERNALCKTIRKAALNDLVTVKNSKTLERAWNRVHNNFNLWLENEDTVTELKDAVSFLGCCGFLTETNPLRITESNLRKAPIPTGWSWKTLDQLSENITSGSRGWKKYMASQGDIFIRSQDIKYDTLIFENKVFVDLPEHVEGMRTLVRPGDLLMTITGANVGKCAQVPQLNRRAYVSQHVALIKIEDSCNTPFLHWWITNNFSGRKHLAKYIYGDKPGLNLTQVGNIPIPLPPPEVQARIVEALEHYQILFNCLASQVEEARNTGELLTFAAVASITGIQIEDKEKMKVPKTEIISTLRIGVSPTNSERAPLVAILIRNDGEMSAKTLWQASGLEIDTFYQRLKTEMARGWIVQPEVAYVREVEAS